MHGHMQAGLRAAHLAPVIRCEKSSTASLSSVVFPITDRQSLEVTTLERSQSKCANLVVYRLDLVLKGANPLWNNLSPLYLFVKHIFFQKNVSLQSKSVLTGQLSWWQSARGMPDVLWPQRQAPWASRPPPVLTRPHPSPGSEGLRYHE